MCNNAQRGGASVDTYVSRELTHFVGRGREPRDQYRLLVEILHCGWLTHPPHDPGRTGGGLRVSPRRRISDGQLYQTEVVCFCDIPVPLRRIHMNKYSEFGISFPKQFLVSRGASPVFYIARTSMVNDLSGSSIARSRYFDEKVAIYEQLVGEFQQAIVSQDRRTLSIANKCLHVLHMLDFHVLSFIKFFDPAKEDDDPENLYMEREWRVYGNVEFDLSDICRITLPSSYVDRLRTEVPRYQGLVTKSEDGFA